MAVPDIQFSTLPVLREFGDGPRTMFLVDLSSRRASSAPLCWVLVCLVLVSGCVTSRAPPDDTRGGQTGTTSSPAQAGASSCTAHNDEGDTCMITCPATFGALLCSNSVGSSAPSCTCGEPSPESSRAKHDFLADWARATHDWARNADADPTMVKLSRDALHLSPEDPTDSSGSIASVDKTDPFDIATVMLTKLDDLQRRRIQKFLGYSYSPTAKEITDYAATSTSGPYKPFSASLKNVQYGETTPLLVADVLASTTYNNGTDLAAQQQFTDTVQITETANWTLVNGLSTTNGLTSTIGRTSSLTSGSTDTDTTNLVVGFNFSGRSAGDSDTSASQQSSSEQDGKSDQEATTVSQAISLSTNKEQIFSTMKTWAWTTTIPVPPHSTVTATVIVKEARVSTTFTAEIDFGGVLWFETATGEHIGIDTTHWFDLYLKTLIESAQPSCHWRLDSKVGQYLPDGIAVLYHVPAFRGCSAPFYLSEDINQLGDVDHIHYKLKGTFSGQKGLNYQIQTAQQPLP